ncbi:efflux RND transporter permease subunit [Alkalicoccus chagannorensis]|uniref:efflux RND transporter permease subunit n=1 Tax=Alkalicoccus chagannorensis TaxID=427072 RepID=UPI0004258E5A|nr:efflux RND transporter permease subunit [Alkalicoccus chagannorensis]
MKLWDFSIRRPKFTIVVMIILLLVGSVSLTRLPTQLVPDVDAPVAAVATTYQGAGPNEVAEDVTEPLENNLSSVSGLNDMSSQSQEGSSIIILEFSADTSVSEVENEINTTINQVDLPDDAGRPNFLQFDPSMFPAVQLAVASSGEDVTDFQDTVADLQQELTRVNDIAQVDEAGTLEERVEVILDLDVMEENGITQNDVAEAIQASETSVPGGTIIDEDDEETITTRILSEIGSIEDMEELVVTQNPETGEEITVGDTADVEENTENQTVITRLNQDPSIQLDVMFESDANTSGAATAFREELDSLLEDDNYDDLEAVILYDEGEFIDEAINSVLLALISGAVLAMVVLFAFLRNLKTPLIIGLAIPLSVITTFALFFFTDISLNLMTIGGLALGIGMLVDNAIVVIENVYRHLSMRKEPKQAASDGTKEVAGAITASTLTTASVFLPIVFVSGFVGDLFAPLAITVAFSLFASLFVALTIVPMLASRILTTPEYDMEAERKQKPYMQKLEKASRWTMRRRAVVLGITILTLVVGVFGLTTQGVDFLPESDEGAFIIEVEHEQGTLLNRTLETVELIEEELDDVVEIESYLSTVGSSSSQGGFTEESHTAEIIVTMVDASDRDVSSFELIDRIEGDIEDTDDTPDITVNAFSQAGLGGDPNTFSFTLQDSDDERLLEAEADVVSILEDEADIRQVDSSEDDTAPELQVTVDRDEAGEVGLTPAQVGMAVNDATSGLPAITLETEDNGTTNVLVLYPDDVLSSVNDFGSILIPGAEGDFVELSSISDVEEGEGPATINRSDMERAVDIDVRYASDLSLAEAGVIVEDAIDEADLADETDFIVGGDQQLLDDAVDDIILAFVLGLIFIYLVMVAQFESFKHPFVVMFTVPLFIIGVLLSLTITQNPLSVMVFIGIIVLAGIVVNNAIVLVDYINQKKEQGMHPLDAIVMAVQDRARPILITALTTILGVLPLAIGIGEGAELIQPMGIVIIGGLVSSTFLTLFVIPVIYSFFDKTTRSMNKKYMTPDGEIVYRRDLFEKEEDQPKVEAGTAAQEPEDRILPEPEERSSLSREEKRQPLPEEKPEPRDQRSEEDIVDEMEELLERMKQNRRGPDDK